MNYSLCQFAASAVHWGASLYFVISVQVASFGRLRLLNDVLRICSLIIMPNGFEGGEARSDENFLGLVYGFLYLYKRNMFLGGYARAYSAGV